MLKIFFYEIKKTKKFNKKIFTFRNVQSENKVCNIYKNFISDSFFPTRGKNIFCKRKIHSLNTFMQFIQYIF